MDIQKGLIAEYERETANTRKILEAIPDDADFAWKPHDKSMPFGRLAAHVSDTNGDWALHTLSHDRLDWTPDMTPATPLNNKDLLARFEKQVGEVKPILAAMTPEKWDSNWKFVAGDQSWIDLLVDIQKRLAVHSIDPIVHCRPQTQPFPRHVMTRQRRFLSVIDAHVPIAVVIQVRTVGTRHPFFGQLCIPLLGAARVLA